MKDRENRVRIMMTMSLARKLTKIRTVMTISMFIKNMQKRAYLKVLVAISLEPVSYTHLTLPTICSV